MQERRAKSNLKPQPLLFETEREMHLMSSSNNLKAISEIRNALFPEVASQMEIKTTPGSPLRTPKAAREELKKLKASYEQVKEFKDR